MTDRIFYSAYLQPNALNMGYLIIASIAILLAVISSLLYLRKLLQNTSSLAWPDALFTTYNGFILSWPKQAKQPESDWQKAQIYGAPEIISHVLKICNFSTRKPDIAYQILTHFAQLKIARNSDKSLQTYLQALHLHGTEFNEHIQLSPTRAYQLNGRHINTQCVVWVTPLPAQAIQPNPSLLDTPLPHLEGMNPASFLSMVNLTPFPIWLIAVNGKLVWANRAYSRIVEASSFEDLIRRQLFLDNEFITQAQGVIASNETTEIIRPVIIAGERRSMTLIMFPVSNGVAGIATDVSHTEFLQKTLIRHQQAHLELMNRSEEAVVIFGRNQKMIFYNQAFIQLFKINIESLKDENGELPSHGQWLDHLREQQLLPTPQDYKQWKESELVFYTDTADNMVDEAWTLPDGRTLRVSRMRDPEGGLAILFADKTSSLLLESQFITLLKVQQATLNRLSEGIAVFGTNGRLKIHNNAFVNLWRLEPENLQDEPHFNTLIDQLLPLYHDRAFWQELKARCTDPSPEVRHPVEGEITRSDDSLLRWLSKPLPDGATLIVWDDITDEHKSQKAQRERAEALETISQLKSEFVNHVSYQLRTPLTTICGFSEWLQDGGAGTLNDKQSEYLSAISSAALELTQTINDILDFAAIEANELDLNIDEVPIYDLLNTALDYVATKADDTRIRLELNCAKDIGFIRADATRLNQAIHYLLSNSMRFTKPGGQIELGAHRAHNNDLTIWVHDNGIGIPCDSQSEVFETFKSSRGGTGLGLALVKHFIEAHGGWVKLESQENEGTRVSCHLPHDAIINSGQQDMFQPLDSTPS